MNLTLLIPAKKESESLPKVLKELNKFDLKTLIVLESKDKETIDTITYDNCEILIQKGRGYGNALIEGINNINTKYFCIFNADGSFDPSEIENMYKIADNNNYDLVFGSRYEKNAGSDDDTIITWLGNKVFSFFGKFFFSLPISDILYTFVLGNTKKTKMLNLKGQDFTFCVELPIKAQRNNYKLISTSAMERSRIAGKKKVNAFKDGFLILLAMIKLFLKN